MPRRPASAVAGWVFASYVLVAAIQTWPLATCLSTGLTGDPAGDAGVYVWNTWVFRHELVDHHHSPLYTESILALEDRADLSLQNYTVFMDLVTLPLQRPLGVVAAFNLAFLLGIPLIGLGMFLLARRVGGPAVGVGEAWLAGFAFASAPFLVARGAGHYSLAAAAPLPFFAWLFDRAWTRRRVRDAALAGACAAWAFYCDPYYAVYCVVIAVALAAGRLWTLQWSPRAWPPGWWRLLDAALILLVGVVLAIVRYGPIVTIASGSISARSLYTPMLLVGVLLAARAWASLQPRLTRAGPIDRRLIPLGLVAGSVGAVLIGPVLYAIALRAMTGHLVGVPVPWRSSAPGVDLLAFFAPNPNHPFAPRALVDWIAREPNGYVENVVSLSWVMLLVIAVAWRREGARPDTVWLGLALGSASLCVGPFLRVAGVNTLLPTPWTLVRYLPVIGQARMPGRIGVLVAMAVAVLFAKAVAALTRRVPAQRPLLLAGIGLALVCELWSAPRPLYSAAIPSIYDVIRRDPRPVSVLELPFGVKDGLITTGEFSPGAQYRQTWHGKPLIGGYLSRIADVTRADYQTTPFTAALIGLSERRPLSDASRAAAAGSAAAFARQVDLGYVVIEDSQATPALRAFAIDTLGLREIGRDNGFTLFAPEITGSSMSR